MPASVGNQNSGCKPIKGLCLHNRVKFPTLPTRQSQSAPTTCTRENACLRTRGSGVRIPSGAPTYARRVWGKMASVGKNDIVQVKDSQFVDDRVDLDGNTFERCSFLKCRMTFRAREPASLLHCSFVDCLWEFQEAAALTADFIRALTNATGDYGKFMLLNTFPELKVWIKDEHLARLAAAEEKPKNG